MSIKDLPLTLRPRERLLACGAQALAPEELLAVLLRTGMPGLGVLDLAGALLREFNSWVPIAIYIAIACLITLFAVWTLRETKGISLQDIDAALHAGLQVGVVDFHAVAAAAALFDQVGQQLASPAAQVEHT